MPSRRFKNLQAAREKQRQEMSQSLPNSTMPEVQLASSVDTVRSTPPLDVQVEEDVLGSADLINMPPVERKSLARGPTIKLVFDERVIAKVPRALFVAASCAADCIIDSKGEVSLPHYYDGHYLDCLVHLIQWLNGVPHRNKLFPPRVSNDLAKAIATYHVAEQLRLIRYIENTMFRMKMRIREQIPSKHDLEVVEKLCIGSQDRFMHMIAGRIAYLIRKKQLKADYIEMLSTFPKIDKVVHQHNAVYEERQKRAAEGAAAAIRRKARRQAAVQSSESRAGRSKQTRDALLAKINEKVLFTAQDWKDAHYYKYTMKDPEFAKVA